MAKVLEHAFNNDKTELAMELSLELDSAQQPTVNSAENSSTSLPLKLEDFHDESSTAWIEASLLLPSSKSEKLLPKASKEKENLSSSCTDIKELYRCVPQIRKHFAVEKQIGCGTFSNVYLATLKKLGEKSPKYALKHIFSTSHPKRIENEIRCLRDIGGVQHVVGIESCIRYKGEVVIIMPYLKHDDFSAILQKMTISDVREYMWQLLLSLQRVHQFNIIHRDVKPNNFLFDLETRRSGLVDFGLAEVLTPTTDTSVMKQKNSLVKPTVKPAMLELTGDLKNAPLDRDCAVQPKAKRRCLAEIQPNTVISKSSVGDEVKKTDLNRKISQDFASKKFSRYEQSCKSENITTTPKRKLADVQDKLSFMSIKSPVSLTNRTTPVSLNKKGSSLTIADVFPAIRKYGGNKKAYSSGRNRSCNCFGKLAVCHKCLARPAPHASRAGTAGFRAPEVLISYQAQTTAVDVWAAGVIMMSLLSGRCPFFRPADDIESLSQLLLIFGSKRIQDVAKILGKKLTCSEQFTGHELRGIIMTLRQPLEEEGPTLRRSPRRRKLTDDIPSPQPEEEESSRGGFDAIDIPDSAFDLLTSLLDPNPRTRITANKALYHEFFMIKI